MAAAGQRLFLARGSRTEVYDVSDPAAPRLVGNIPVSGGLQMSGDLLLMNRMTTLSVYDVTDASNARLAGVYESLERIESPTVLGDRYFFRSYNSIYIVDLSDAASPRLAGKYGPVKDGSIAEFAPAADRVYLTTSRGVEALDIRNPATPTRIGGYTPTTSSVRTAVVTGAYVLATDPGYSDVIDFLDLSNLTNPVRVAQIKTTRLISDLSVIGRYGYVSFHNQLSGERALGVIDMTDLRNPRMVTEQAHTNNFWSLNAVNNYVVGLGPAGLTTLDFSNPLAPRQVATVPTATYIWQMIVRGSRAYIAGGADGLYVVDLLNPANPQVLGRFQTNSVNSVDVRGAHAFVATGEQILVVDVSNPAAMKVVGAYNDGQTGNSIRVNQDTAYAAGAAGTAVLDISDPTRATLKFRSTLIGSILDFAPPYFIQLGIGKLEIAELTAANPQPIKRATISRDVWDVAVAGRYAYLASPQTNIQIMDIADSGAPRKVGEIPIRAGRLHLNGRYLYATDSLFQIIDISDPLNPVLRGALNEKVHSVAVSGSYAYAGTDYVVPENRPSEFLIINVTNKAAPFVTARRSGAPAIALRWPYVFLGGAGIGVLDVSDPNQPVSLGGFGGFGTANETEVTVAGNYLYSVGHFGFHVSDISDPNNATWLGSYKEHGFRGRRVRVVGQYAYVIDFAGLLHVFDVSRPAQPRRVGGNMQANPPAPTTNPFQIDFGLYASPDTLYFASQNEFTIMDVFRADPNALRITSLQPILPESARLRLSGPAGTTVHVESTPDFSAWTPLQSYTLREVPMDVADPSADSTTHFYRLSSP
jgi:hypothetical protein